MRAITTVTPVSRVTFDSRVGALETRLSAKTVYLTELPITLPATGATVVGASGILSLPQYSASSGLGAVPTKSIIDLSLNYMWTGSTTGVAFFLDIMMNGARVYRETFGADEPANTSCKLIERIVLDIQASDDLQIVITKLYGDEGTFTCLANSVMTIEPL